MTVDKTTVGELVAQLHGRANVRLLWHRCAKRCELRVESARTMRS